MARSLQQTISAGGRRRGIAETPNLLARTPRMRRRWTLSAERDVYCNGTVVIVPDVSTTLPRTTLLPLTWIAPPELFRPTVFPLTTERESRTVADEAAGTSTPTALLASCDFSSVSAEPDSALIPDVLFPDSVAPRSDASAPPCAWNPIALFVSRVFSIELLPVVAWIPVVLL